MAELTTIARPYAEAAFALAQEAGALPAWSAMLHTTRAVVADPRIATALDRPNLTAADKESLLLSVLGDKVDALFRNLLRVLVRNDRIAIVGEVAVLFDARMNDINGVARAKITSAFPLSEADLGLLTASLEKRFGRRIEATVSVDSELVGGARIEVGDTVIDGTVQSQLAAMARQLRA